MSEASIRITVFLAAGGLLLLLLFAMGLYVWKDASGRNMNPVLWTLVAVLAPAYTGFVIYLLVRSNFPDLQCPSCACAVERTYAVCPGCGARLRRACPNCGFPAEEDWVICPRCAKPLPEDSRSVTPPVRKRDTMLRKILLLVFFVPAVLFLLLCILNLSVSRGGLMVSSLGSYDEEKMEYYQNVPEIREWLQNSRQKDPEGIYVLRYQAETDEKEAARRKKTVYLIYRPSAGYMKKVDQSTKNRFSGRTDAVITFEDTTDPGWAHAYYPMTCYIHEGYDYEGLILIVDGQKADYELQEIDFDPSLEACYIRDGIFDERETY